MCYLQFTVSSAEGALYLCDGVLESRQPQPRCVSRERETHPLPITPLPAGHSCLHREDTVQVEYIEGRSETSLIQGTAIIIPPYCAHNREFLLYTVFSTNTFAINKISVRINCSFPN